MKNKITLEMLKDLKKYGYGLIPLISKEHFIKKHGISPGRATGHFNIEFQPNQKEKEDLPILRQ